MIEALVSDEELHRRVFFRRARDTRGGERKRINCKRCGKKIPEHRRRDAIYCSDRCHRDYRREEITKLRTEMRAEVRKLTYATECPECGKSLNNGPGRRGPAAKWCGKVCRDRIAQRRRRERAKSSQTTEAA